MRTVAHALGYQITHTRELGGPIGILLGRTIVVLDKLDPNTEALTIGHELAHAINDEYLIFDNTDPAIEQLMDAVAIAILVPRKDVLDLAPPALETTFNNIDAELLANRLISIALHNS